MDISKRGFESRLIPILREGIDVVKMILFKKIKEMIISNHEDKAEIAARLAGAVLNEIFSTPNSDPSFAAFCREHEQTIGMIIHEIPIKIEEMLIPLTDALRTGVMCDHQEKKDNSAVLIRAKDLGVLLSDREMPMPHQFIELVRRLGNAFNVLTPLMPENQD